MAKNALCIGINDYPGTQNDLSGCVNDAADWRAALEARGFTVRSLIDSQATRAHMVGAMRELITSAKAGDSAVITYSGHGTFVPDLDGDEPDGRDEALCPYDIDQGNVLIDDDIHQLFAERAAGVKIVLISDSCHSGSVIRWAPPDPTSTAPRPRFLPPAAWLSKDKLPKDSSGAVPTRYGSSARLSTWLGSLSLAGGDLLMAGSRDQEYSYDAQFGGRANGAFTYCALKTLVKLPAGATYAEWYKEIRKYLPGASYPQTPQIFGAKRSQKFKVLA
jgi:metacaspase-1